MLCLRCTAGLLLLSAVHSRGSAQGAWAVQPSVAHCHERRTLPDLGGWKLRRVKLVCCMPKGLL